MHKVATVNTRMEPGLKARAENILSAVGLSSAEAVRLFYTQVCLNKGLPFAIKIPNKKTIQALKDVQAGRTYKAVSVAELFEKLE